MSWHYINKLSIDLKLKIIIIGIYIFFKKGQHVKHMDVTLF